MKRLFTMACVALPVVALSGCAKPTISLAEFHARQGNLPVSASLRRGVLPCAADTSAVADPRYGQSMPYYRGQTC